jgi:hypothetical protein
MHQPPAVTPDVAPPIPAVFSGNCFRCLVATCTRSTRCFRYHGFRHLARDCTTIGEQRRGVRHRGHSPPTPTRQEAEGRSLSPRPECRVTESPKIVPYYRLSLSTWPLSNNKELFCRFRRVKPGHTTGSLICAKPARRRDKSTTLHYIKRFTSSTLLQTRFFVHESKGDSKFQQRKVN